MCQGGVEGDGGLCDRGRRGKATQNHGDHQDQVLEGRLRCAGEWAWYSHIWCGRGDPIYGGGVVIPYMVGAW